MNLGFTVGTAIADAVREKEQQGFWHDLGTWTNVWVREVIERHDPIRFERWQTQADERTCPICGQLDGRVWQEGEGYHPPVHDFCRCTRVLDHIQLTVRTEVRWRQERRYQADWQWRTSA